MENNTKLAELYAVDMQMEDQDKLVKELMNQMEGIGFCLVTNVPGHDEDGLLTAIKAFHALPLEAKIKLAPWHFNDKNPNKYRGYFPFLKNDPSHKEFYDMTRDIKDISEWERKGCPLYEERPWLEDKQHDWILKKFEEQYKIWHDLSLKLIGCLALGLGKR